jgi:hypothetical protein
MSKSFFLKKLLLGGIYFLTGLAVINELDPGLLNNSLLMVMMILSTAMYPLSRYVVGEWVSRIFSPSTWTRLSTGSQISGMTALCELFCMVLAVPFGLGYLVWIAYKKG